MVDRPPVSQGRGGDEGMRQNHLCKAFCAFEINLCAGSVQRQLEPARREAGMRSRDGKESTLIISETELRNAFLLNRAENTKAASATGLKRGLMGIG